jgi:hypothetical protein
LKKKEQGDLEGAFIQLSKPPKTAATT